MVGHGGNPAGPRRLKRRRVGTRVDDHDDFGLLPAEEEIEECRPAAAGSDERDADPARSTIPGDGGLGRPVVGRRALFWIGAHGLAAGHPVARRSWADRARRARRSASRMPARSAGMSRGFSRKPTAPWAAASAATSAVL